MSHRRQRKMPPDPEPWLRHLTPELRDNPKSVAWAKAKDEHDAAMRDFHRKLVDLCEVYRACPHAGCRRARRCARPDVTCFEAALPMLRRDVFPWLRPELKKRAEADMSPESRL